MKKDLEALIAKLPEGRGDLKLLPFLDIWPEKSQDAMELRDVLYDPKNTLASIVNRKISSNLMPAAEDFLCWSGFDLESDINEMRRDMEKHENWWDILKRRAGGETLESISKTHGLTRERIRQISVRCVEEFANRDGERLLGKIYAMENGREVIRREELTRYFGDDMEAYFYMFQQIADQSTLFRYHEKLASFVFGTRHDEALRQAGLFVNEMPSVFPDQQLQSYLDQAASRKLEESTVLATIRSVYEYRGNSWHRGKVRIHNVCSGIMERFYPEGVYIYDKETLAEFRRHAEEIYGTAVQLPPQDHALTAVIGRIGMLCGRGIYRPVKHRVIPPQLLEEIKTYMREAGQQSYMFNTLFSVFREKLLAYGVDNRFYLQGVLKADLGEGYEFTRDYVTETGKVTKIQDIIVEAVKEYDEPVTKVELSGRFQGVPDIAISYALMTPDVVNYFGSYMHLSRLKITEEEKNAIIAEADEMIRDGRPHTAEELLNICQKKYPEVLSRIFIRTQFAMYSFLGCIAPGRYEMDRPQIARLDSEGGRAMQAKRQEELAARKPREKNQRPRRMASFEEVVDYVSSCGLKGTSVNALHSKFHVTRQQLTLLQQDPRIVVMHDRLIHESAMVGWESARDRIYDVVAPMMAEYGVLRKNALYATCQPVVQDFLTENRMDSEDDVFYLCRHLFEKVHYRDADWHFHLHSQSVSTKRGREDISFYGQVTEFCRKLDRPITYEELKERFTFLGYKTNSLKYNMRLCEEPAFYIYQPDTYIMAEKLKLTDAWFDGVRASLGALLKEHSGIVVFREITDAWLQEHLPAVPYRDLKWTSLLLQQMCIFYHDRIGARTIRSFGIYDYNNLHSFLVEDNGETRLLQDVLWDWLLLQGYGGKTLTIPELWELLVERKVMDPSVMESIGQFSGVLRDRRKYDWDMEKRAVTILEKAPDSED